MTAGTLHIEGRLRANGLPAGAAVTAAIYRVPATHYAARIKRLLDIFISLCLIILIMSWLVPVLFLVIKLSSRGPLFFVQSRVGLNGRVFPCLKFRSMFVGSETQTGDINIRITRPGFFLRCSHIDELPQVFNVLAGHMSLIGPRPHMLDDDKAFSAQVNSYPLRHLVRPGITGLAQAHGLHGNTPDYFSIAHRTRLDLFYVRKLGFGLDLRILLQTLRTSGSHALKSLRNGYKGQ